jgi:ferritin
MKEEIQLENLFSDAMKNARTERDFETIKFVTKFVSDSFFDEERDLNDVKFWLSTIGEKNDK